MEVEVYDVNCDDTVYELKLKMQQNLDYAPNRFPPFLFIFELLPLSYPFRLKIAQGDIILDENSKTLIDYNVKKSIPLYLTILDIADDGISLFFSVCSLNFTHFSR